MGRSFLPFLLVLNILTQGWISKFVLAQSASFPAVVFIGTSPTDVGVNNYIISGAKANFPPYGRDFVYGNLRGPTGRFGNGRILPDIICKKFLDILVHFRVPAFDPELQDVDLLTGSPAWIFIPVHGKQHWSLAIIRLIGNECRLCHLDSHPGIHKKSKIFHVLKTFLAHTMPIDTNQIVEDSFEVDEQKDEYSCGFHVLQMLTGAGTKELALDRCYMVERLGSIATLDQVTSFELVFASYLTGSMKGVPI
ncbi:hypothetical protein R1sor_026255 [Riccia sorocarpa]|uniref:Ubiquitin-like protease family profile domain-containing protein n=1 Tax=Riccia sorocarpa TaxID=122646 RepID=A0ABD3GAX1_9MARC